MKKLMLLLIVGIVLLNTLGATETCWETYKQGDEVELIQTCPTCSFNNITSVVLANKTVIDLNQEMTKVGTVYNFTFLSNYTNSLGIYLVNGIGDLDGTNEIWGCDFEITYSGIQLTTAQSIIYSILLGIFIFFFIITIFGINKLPASNAENEDGRIISISLLKYLRGTLWMFEWMFIIAIVFLSSNLAFAYLGDDLFAQLLFNIYQITFALTPLIIVVWFSWILVRMYHDKKFQRMLKRGIFPQGRNF